MVDRSSVEYSRSIDDECNKALPWRGLVRRLRVVEYHHVVNRLPEINGER